MMAPLPLGRVVATPGALKLLTEAGEHPFELPGSPCHGRLGRAVRLRPPPERDRPARRLPGPQLLPRRRGARLDHHRGRPLRHHHPPTGGVLMMPCELCGGGDVWIKTCLTPEGSRLLVCDPCYEEHASVLVIVPGDRTVTARCDHVLALRQPQGVRGGQPWRTQERLLGDVRGVRGGGSRDGSRGAAPAARLPAG